MTATMGAEISNHVNCIGILQGSILGIGPYGWIQPIENWTRAIYESDFVPAMHPVNQQIQNDGESRLCYGRGLSENLYFVWRCKTCMQRLFRISSGSLDFEDA